MRTFSGGSPANWEATVDIVKIRMLWWFKTKTEAINITVNDMLINTDNSCRAKMKKFTRKKVDWTPPDSSSLKMNIDGTVRGKPGEGGIGGVLRDYKGRVLALFSKSMGVVDSNFTDFRAILEGLRLYMSSEWANNFNLILESDSSVAVNWAKDVECKCWKYVNTYNEVRNVMEFVGNGKFIFIIHILRNSNGLAYSLVKAGVCREIGVGTLQLDPKFRPDPN